MSAAIRPAARPAAPAAAVAPSRGSTAALVAARVLLAAFGAVTAAGTVFFTFFAPVEEGGVSGAADWAVAAWSAALAAATLYAALRLGDRTRRSVRLAQGVLLGHLAFGLVKLVGYGETASVPFAVADLVLLGLLAAVRPVRP